MADQWNPDDDLAALAKQLHDERCISWGCPGTPHTLDWLLARKILKGKVDGPAAQEEDDQACDACGELFTHDPQCGYLADSYRDGTEGRQ